MAGRRRQIQAKGRPIVLRRRASVGATPLAVTMMGKPYTYRPEQLTGGIVQGDQSVATMNDEILAAGWPGPPRKNDEMVVDGLVWVVQAAFAMFEGIELIGYDIWIRGGR